ncbi:MAG TPA: phosphotransacetylase family protein [Candidatus Limnocylindrales bacterium]|nr:phosphotransacetylase family protein [Candidatus Limnocylindrales bacterium]
MRLYVASTSSFAGKTLVALALAKLWALEGVAVGYVKPLGKIPVSEGGGVVDEDASFLAGELGLPGPPEAICPVVITQDLVMAAYRGEPLRLKERVLRAASEAASRTGVLLIGGTANLRDGTFLGISPLALISELDCQVLLVDRFSGEKSMDQILWAAGVLRERFLGIVFNRVAKAQEAFLRESVRPYFEARNLRVFGAIPSDPVLDSVSVKTLAERLSADVASGGERLDTMIERFCVGAMDVDSALRVFRRIPRKAVITGGHRADIQLAALETETRCLVLTGGVVTNELILSRAQECGVPILVVQEDTLFTVEKFENLMGRLRIREKEKIERGVNLVRENVDTAGILSALRGGGPGRN